MRQEHIIPPFYDESSRILILGTMPSPKSREIRFYYGHPQNRFWRVLADVLEEPIPQNNEERKALLRRNYIALWDVIESCEIKGASDSSIRNVMPNDIASLVKKTSIRHVFTTGKTAYKLYKKYCEDFAGIPAIPLPSTSPANQGRFPYDRLKQEWLILYDYLK